MKNIFRFSIKEFLLLFFSVILTVISFYYVYLGFFMRPLADDFCTLSVVKNFGFWGALKRHFGIRYGSSIFSFGISLLGERSFRYLILFLFLSILFLSIGFLKIVVKKINKELVVHSLLLSTTIFVSIFLLTPNKIESIYWFGASSVYTWPLIFFGFAILCFFYFYNFKEKLDNRSFLQIFMIFLLFLFSFGFSEVFTMAVLPVLVVPFLFAVMNKWKLKYYFTVPIIANFFALIIMFFSPAKTRRIQKFVDLGIDTEPSLFKVLSGSLKETVLFIERSFTAKNMLFIFFLFLLFYCVFMLMIRQKCLKILNKKILTAFLIAVPVCIWFSYIPNYYVFGEAGPSRTLIVPTYYKIFFLVIVSLIFAAETNIKKILGYFHKKDVRVLLFIIASFFFFSLGWFMNDFFTKHSPYNIMKKIRIYFTLEIKSYKQIAENYDKVENNIFEARKKQGDLTVNKIGLNGIFHDYSKDPLFWMNICASQYYGVKSIKAK